MASKPGSGGGGLPDPMGVFKKNSGGGGSNRRQPMGGSKPSGAKPGYSGGGSSQFESANPFWNDPALMLTKETDTTYGGTKPGKAPTLKAPDAPDPFEIIRAQGTENRVNENGPSGSTTYYRDPTTGVWTANRSFSPELQGIYNNQVNMIGQGPDAYNERVANAMFNRQRSLLDPVFSEQERSLESKLANQGLPIGSEAYNTDMSRFQRTREDTLSNLANQAVLSGTQAGQAQRQAEFNQMAALLGGQQVGPTAPIDVTGPFNSQYQGQLNAVNMANQNSASRNAQTTSGAASLAGMLAMMSIMSCSKELKEDFEKIDDNAVLDGVDSLTVEKWSYKDDGTRHIGPYAEEFREIFGLGDGKSISVIDAFGVCLASIKALTSRVKELEAAQ